MTLTPKATKPYSIHTTLLRSNSFSCLFFSPIFLQTPLIHCVSHTFHPSPLSSKCDDNNNDSESNNDGGDLHYGGINRNNDVSVGDNDNNGCGDNCSSNDNDGDRL